MIGQLVNFGGGNEFKPKTNRALIYSLLLKKDQLENQKPFMDIKKPVICWDHIVL
jgi:hypothetical protein